MNSEQDKGLRVAFVEHTSSLGGGQLTLVNYFSHESVHARRLYVMAEGALERNARAHDIPVHVENGGRSGRAGDLVRARRILDRVTRDGVDVIVLNSRYVADLVSVVRRKGPLYAAYLHEEFSAKSMGFARRALTTRLLLPRLDGLLANSLWTASTVPANLRRLPLALAYPVPGVRSIPRQYRQSADEPLRLLYLGRVVRMKGIDVILRALEQTPKALRERVTLTVAGGRPSLGGGSAADAERYERELRASVEAGRLPVRFLGHVDDVTPLLASHDVLISASTEPESFGQSVAQGLSAGMITIATSHGGPTELIQSGKNGLLVEPGNARALADELARLVKSPDDGARLGTAAARTNEALSDERTSAALDTALSDLVHAMRLGRRLH